MAGVTVNVLSEEHLVRTLFHLVMDPPVRDFGRSLVIELHWVRHCKIVISVVIILFVINCLSALSFATFKLHRL